MKLEQLTLFTPTVLEKYTKHKTLSYKAYMFRKLKLWKKTYSIADKNKRLYFEA